MIGPLLRRLLIPLLAVGLVVLALSTSGSPDAASPEAAPAAASAPPLEDPFSTGLSGGQADQLLRLWRSWGPDLMPTTGGARPDLPPELMTLSYGEASYVLLSARAAQVAAAGAGDPGEGRSDVLADSDLSPDPQGVTTSPVADGRTCLALRWSDEPYGRTFYGLLADSDEAGPEPLSALEGELLLTVRVGLQDTDDATCGAGGVAFSPAAQRVLAVLSPALLPH